jgi:DNA modification methylase
MQITPYAKNAKKHPKKQIEQVANSIKEFGMHQNVVVDSNGVIIVGHGRYEAMKHLGWDDSKIWAHVTVVDITEEQAKAYRLADNKLNESEWDMNLVIEELKELSEPMVELTGFDTDLIIEPDEQDDEVPDVPEEPQSKLGDLYELGNHRVLCGDSTKIEDVERLMDGKKADMVFTDPPYGIDWNTDYTRFTGGLKPSENIYSKIENDQKQFDPTWFLAQFETCLFFGANCFSDKLPKGNWIVWDKRFDNDAAFLADAEVAWYNGSGAVYIIKETHQGFVSSDTKLFHPTQKPVKLFEKIFEKIKAPERLFDPFLGSGSTLIASEKTGRVCYGMELDPKYVDVIVQRYVDYTGNTKIKRNGEEIIWEGQEK